MGDLSLTKHALSRLSKRGRSESDIAAVLRFGTRIDEHVIVLLNKDAEREITQRKREIARLERLRGWKVVEDEGRIITTYRPTKFRVSRRCRR